MKKLIISILLILAFSSTVFAKERKIIEYRVIEIPSGSFSGCADALNGKVNSLLKDGYELYGAPCTNVHYIYQALVRYEENK